jgi:hypothetical protein
MIDLVLITSVINTGNQPWSYTAKRSVYSSQERFEQTLQTIDSIRKYLPNSKILLTECSQLPEDIQNILISKTDYYVNAFNNEEARYACIESNKKGLGQAMSEKIGINFILKNNISFDRFFKISGRYWLNENFDEKNFGPSSFTFKKRASNTLHNVIAISTVVYSFPFNLFEEYIKAVNSSIHYYLNNGTKGYEEVFPILCEPRTEINIIGVSGYVAVTQNDFFTA